MRSQLFKGSVRHRRRGPVAHEFRYPSTMLWLDLDEIDDLVGRGWFARDRWFAAMSFCRADHWGSPERPLTETIRDLVATESGSRPGGSIYLLTYLRYWGYFFSPLNLYFCFDESEDSRPVAIVAEVNNIPWRERHVYVLHQGNAIEGSRGGDAPLRYRHEKAFHVSPFMDMALQYRWAIRMERDKSKVTSLAVHLENLASTADGQWDSIFDASLSLTGTPLTRWNLMSMLIRYPWMSVQVVAAIYWEAFRLWLKKCPYYPHPRYATTSAAGSR